MQLARVRRHGNAVGVVAAVGGKVWLLDLAGRSDVHTLADILHSPDPEGLVRELLRTAAERAWDSITLLPPVDSQEIWAAGVTYKRSEEARKRESVGAAVFYDKVYTAERPELFLKAPAWRAV